jgi:hypothetical protein
VAAVVALATLAASMIVAGCGVPSSSQPTVVRSAAQKGTISDRAPIARDGPGAITDAQELVRRYLRAMAWGNETTVDTDAMSNAVNFAKGFLTPEARNSWQRGPDIVVVRTQLGIPVVTPNVTRVEVAMQPVGVLDRYGKIEPRPDLPAQNYQFMVVPATDVYGEFRIANPPSGMLLSDDALTKLYDLNPIYFWDSNNRNLVPDLRYISKAQTANRNVELMGWLRTPGPSEYLRQAVNEMPTAIEFKDRPVQDGSRLRINLSAKAANPQAELWRFVLQVRWTLNWLSGAIDLQIEGQHQDVPTRDVMVNNPAATPDGQREAPRFCVVDGQVRQYAGEPLSLPVLAHDANAGVVSAAIIHGPAHQIALVREDGPGGKVRLWLGNDTQKTAQYTGTDLVASTMSRPVGLAGPGARVLVAADGHLYDVPFDSKQPRDETPPNIGAVTAVSVAPDGRRVALVAGGRAYVGVLQVPADSSSISVVQTRELPVGLSDVTGIAWSRAEWVVVAGRSAGQSALVEATIDGALIQPLQLRNLPGPTVTRVVADPVFHPSDQRRDAHGLIMLEANGHSYNVFSGSVMELNPDPTLVPPSSPPGKQPVLTAPFFLD